MGEWQREEQRFEHPLAMCIMSNRWYRFVQLSFSILPFWVRLMQCMRGYHDTHNTLHLWNGLKYSCSIGVAVLARFHGRTAAWLTLSIIATTYSGLWDIFLDWGHGPPWLRRLIDGDRFANLRAAKGWGMWRPHTHVSRRQIYVVVAANLLMRCTWTIYVAPGKVVTTQHTILLWGLIELVRRAVWSYFRVEWEEAKIRLAGELAQADEHAAREAAEALASGEVLEMEESARRLQKTARPMLQALRGVASFSSTQSMLSKREASSRRQKSFANLARPVLHQLRGVDAFSAAPRSSSLVSPHYHHEFGHTPSHSARHETSRPDSSRDGHLSIREGIASPDPGPERPPATPAHTPAHSPRLSDRQIAIHDIFDQRHPPGAFSMRGVSPKRPDPKRPDPPRLKPKSPKTTPTQSPKSSGTRVKISPTHSPPQQSPSHQPSNFAAGVGIADGLPSGASSVEGRAVSRPSVEKGAVLGEMRAVRRAPQLSERQPTQEEGVNVVRVPRPSKEDASQDLVVMVPRTSKELQALARTALPPGQDLPGKALEPVPEESALALPPAPYLPTLTTGGKALEPVLENSRESSNGSNAGGRTPPPPHRLISGFALRAFRCKSKAAGMTPKLDPSSSAEPLLHAAAASAEDGSLHGASKGVSRWLHAAATPAEEGSLHDAQQGGAASQLRERSPAGSRWAVARAALEAARRQQVAQRMSQQKQQKQDPEQSKLFADRDRWKPVLVGQPGMLKRAATRQAGLLARQGTLQGGSGGYFDTPEPLPVVPRQYMDPEYARNTPRATPRAGGYFPVPVALPAVPRYLDAEYAMTPRDSAPPSVQISQRTAHGQSTDRRSQAAYAGSLRAAML